MIAGNGYRALRLLGRLALGCGLVAGALGVALHNNGLTLRNWVEGRALERDIRALGARSDQQLRASTNRAVRAYGGAALAQTIRASRDQARRAGTRTIPPAIARALAPHFPSIDLDDVRWTPADGRLNLGTVLTRWYMREGAVVLDDVVVFTSASTTDDMRLWAHELTHVLQYRELGVDGFARTYAVEYAALERQAESNAQRIMAELGNGA